jgi:hypothetical protein
MLPIGQLVNVGEELFIVLFFQLFLCLKFFRVKVKTLKEKQKKALLVKFSVLLYKTYF